MSSLSFLFLAGCHVFESALVECTSDMPCAVPDDTAVDTADSGVDTADTGPTGTPSVGWVTSMAGGGNSVVRVFDPVTGEVAQEWTGFGEYSGAAYYEPESQAAVLVAVNYVIQLKADGNVGTIGEGPASEAYDVTHLGPYMLAAYRGGLAELSADYSHNEDVLPAGSLAEIRFVGGNRNIAYYVDPTDGGPDLWSIDPSGLTKLVLQDYDTSLTRATNIFVGPDDKPFGCSTAGAIYDVGALADGNTHPYAYYDDGLTDVADCAWDAGNKTFLLYSPTRGVLRVDLYGHGTWVFAPSAGYEYARVYWYGN